MGGVEWVEWVECVGGVGSVEVVKGVVTETMSQNDEEESTGKE